ncbi:reverse transcriptase domain-containing protein [Tanacetum coccineum]
MTSLMSPAPTTVVEKDEMKNLDSLYNGDQHNGSGAEKLVLIGPNRMKYTYAPRLNFDRTNNKAEYEVLLAATENPDDVDHGSMAILSMGNEYLGTLFHRLAGRFMLPIIIMTDNGTQFVNDLIQGGVEPRLNVRQMNTVVAYPQANGLVERANKCLIEGIKIRLGRDRVGWVDELPNVLGNT